MQGTSTRAERSGAVVYSCTCGFITSNRSAWAGHRSGHSRAGEQFAASHPCHLCEHTFSSGMQLGSHVKAVHTLKFASIRTWEQLKKYQRKPRLISERGHRCEICGNIEWRNQPIALELDHIDGNNENNDKSNCRLICPNCHAQTSTYKGRNIGKHKTETSVYRRAYRIRTRSLAVRQPDFNLVPQGFEPPRVH